MARTGAEAPPAKMGRRASAATPMGSRERASHPTAEMVIEQPPLRGSRPVLLPTSVRSSAQTISPTVTTEALPGTCPPTENCESRVTTLQDSIHATDRLLARPQKGLCHDASTLRISPRAGHQLHGCLAITVAGLPPARRTHAQD